MFSGHPVTDWIQIESSGEILKTKEKNKDIGMYVAPSSW